MVTLLRRLVVVVDGGVRVDNTSLQNYNDSFYFFARTALLCHRQILYNLPVHFTFNDDDLWMVIIAIISFMNSLLLFFHGDHQRTFACISLAL